MGNLSQANYFKNDRVLKYGAFLTFSLWMTYCNFKKYLLILFLRVTYNSFISNKSQ